VLKCHHPPMSNIVPNASISQRFLSNLGPSHQGATANKEIDTTMSKGTATD
jgi:hypothetical protein